MMLLFNTQLLPVLSVNAGSVTQYSKDNSVSLVLTGAVHEIISESESYRIQLGKELPSASMRTGEIYVPSVDQEVFIE